MKTLAIDLETYCELDIKKVGTYKYAENCEILLCAYAFDDEPVKIIDLACGEYFPAQFTDALFDKKILKTAYNAAFEIQVLEKYFGKKIETSQWQCTMVLGLTLGLPAGLEQLGKVLNLESDKRKLTVGKKLISYFSKPCNKPQSVGLWDIPEHKRNFPEHNVEKWKLFKEYCKQDVETERFIRKKLEKFSPPKIEKSLWSLDQKINGNGVLVDMKLVDRAIKIDALIRSETLLKGAELTDGLNINSNQQMLDWLEEQEGWRPSSFDKTARAEMKTENPKVKKLLELKNLISKTSVKKYETMSETVCDDGRARGMFQFYGANRTGRWAGRLIQLQNLPQNHLEDLDIARQYVRDVDIDMFFIFYDKPSEVLSQLIRTAFIAEKGSRFIVADFSAIEARVIAWLADEKWRLKVFADGGDIYCASASEMFKVPVEKHGKNKELRQKGKIAELACGYGGGVGALKAFGADKMGLSDEEMQSIIEKWRLSSPNICKLWRDVESAAKNAVQFKKPFICAKGIVYEVVDNFLFATLPSGRKIAYYKPSVEDNQLKYEGSLQAAGGWGINHTWGGKLVENLVQAIARDCLAKAMLRIDAAGYKIVMHVHDEIICETPNGQGSLAEMIEIMRQPIKSLDGLVLNADGYETEYYRKD